MKEVFDKYFKRIALFCNGIVKNMEDAEDIAGEVFYELYKRFDKFDTEDKIKAFLFIVAKRKCLNVVRVNKQYKMCELSDDYIDHAEINATVIDMLYKKIHEEVSGLPRRQREIAELALTGFSPHEIADKLKISHKTVCNLKWVIYNNMRPALSAYLKQHVYEE